MVIPLPVKGGMIACESPSESNPGVAAGRLDQLLARPQQAIAFGSSHHRRANAALHRISRIAAFDLGEHPGTTALADPVELHQGRAADREAVVAEDRGHRSAGEHRQCPHPNEGSGRRTKPT